MENSLKLILSKQEFISHKHYIQETINIIRRSMSKYNKKDSTLFMEKIKVLEENYMSEFIFPLAIVKTLLNNIQKMRYQKATIKSLQDKKVPEDVIKEIINAEGITLDLKMKIIEYNLTIVEISNLKCVPLKEVHIDLLFEALSHQQQLFIDIDKFMTPIYDTINKNCPQNNFYLTVVNFYQTTKVINTEIYNCLKILSEIPESSKKKVSEEKDIFKQFSLLQKEIYNCDTFFDKISPKEVNITIGDKQVTLTQANDK